MRQPELICFYLFSKVPGEIIDFVYRIVYLFLKLDLNYYGWISSLNINISYSLPLEMI